MPPPPRRLYRPSRKKGHPFALTARCVAPLDWKGVLLGAPPDPAAFARHLARCPACRRVALDLARGGLAEGKPVPPDPGTVALARAWAERFAPPAPAAPAAAPEPPAARIAARLSDPIALSGPESAVVVVAPRPGGVSRIATSAPGFRAVFSFERTAPGRFVLRVAGAPEGTVLRLERIATADGRYVPIDKGRRGERIAWTGLTAGAYRLRALSEAGERIVAFEVERSPS